MGTDIEEILKMGAEQAMRVDSVQVFKPEEFPAFKGFLNGYLPVAARKKKHFHWETFTFVKAYSWPDEQKFTLSIAKKLEKTDTIFAHRHYQRIGYSTPIFHAYRPHYVQEVTIQFDDFIWKEDEVSRLDEQIVKMIHQVAGNLVVKVSRNKVVNDRSKGNLSHKPSMKSPASHYAQGGRRPEMIIVEKCPLVQHIMRTYQIYWQGVVVPLSAQMFDEYQEAMRHELSQCFTQHCDRLCACKVVLSQKAVKAGGG